MGADVFRENANTYYARFADFRFFGAAFFDDFLADFRFAVFFAAFFFAAIKIFLLCKSESIYKLVFMITTVIITLDIISMTLIHIHTREKYFLHVDNFL